jgi:osmotically-inducible protein OsmY
MNDRYGWDDRNDNDRYRRQSGSSNQSGSDQSRDQDRLRSEDEDWRSRSNFGPDRQDQGGSDFDRGQRQGGPTPGYGQGRGAYGASGNQGRDGYGGGRAYASQGGQRQPEGQRRYSSSDYGYGQQGEGQPQPYYTGQQQGWEVPSSSGAPGTFASSYGGGTGTYGGGAGGAQGFGEDYRDRSSRGRQNERGFLQKAGDEIASWFGDDDAAQRREQDHRGRGPAGYTRSDERIRDDANDRLTEDWRVDASSISVAVESGEVTLSGTVSRREDKRRAEDIVEDISGVKHVQNNLRVQQTPTWSGDSGTATSAGGATGSSSVSSAGSSTSGASATTTGAKDALSKDGANTAPT